MGAIEPANIRLSDAEPTNGDLSLAGYFGSTNVMSSSGWEQRAERA